MKRQGVEGEFRSNLHNGGSAEIVKITPTERAIAVKALKVLGLKVGGVDLVRSDRGPLILEVNSSPGLEGIEAVTEKNVADSIIEFIEKDINRTSRTQIFMKG
jgi:ribosomal protein S6--L-glutamate ligase